MQSDRWLEKGDYFKMKSLEIGYTFSSKMLKAQNLKDCSLRIYFSAENLLTITNYTGLDPEMVNAYIWHRGMDWGAYPNSKNLIVGLQMNF
jgi:hypothetical protein